MKVLQTTADQVAAGDRVLSQATGQVLTVTATAKITTANTEFVYMFYAEDGVRDALFTKTAARTPVDIIPRQEYPA